MDIKYYLAWICIIHLSLFACLLWSKKTNREANRILAIVMVCFASIHFSHILILTHVVAKFHFLNEFCTILVFLLGPFYLQYVSSISDIKILWKKYFYLHLLPFIPVIVWNISFFYKTDDQIITYYENALIKQPLAATILTSIATLQMGFYLIWSVLLLNRYSNYLKRENTNELLNLKWLRSITISFLLVTFIIAPLVISLVKNDVNTLYIYYPVMTMLILATIFYKSMNLPNAEIEKKRIREHVREKISRDIHDDLGSGLSKISFLSNNLKQQLQHDKNSADQIEKISQTSQDLVSNMSHIIWAENPENDTIDSLLAYIREYAVDFLDDCGLQCHINFPETTSKVNILSEQKRNLFLVIKESLNNIFKHASATQVWIDILIHKDELNISIKDDGKGFIKGQSHSGNGLKNMQYRMERIGGKYKIDVSLGKGTCTQLSLPLN